MNNSKIFLPISIIVAGLIIAGAIFFTRDGVSTGPDVVDNSENSPEELAIKPVSEDDHILGNPDAEIIIVEYSDFECPFCANFHPTMTQIIEQYGETGEVAWVYRHFPIDQIHPLARPAAEASECVASLGGNEAFWAYAELLFSGAPTSLESEDLIEAAVQVGIEEEAFNSCVASGEFADEVQADYEDGAKIARSDSRFGTPYSLIITKDGIQAPIRGAQPYSVLQPVIESLLNQ